MSEPDLSQLTDLQTPWCIHTVATLRIAEHMAAGLSSAADLAAAAGCDPAVLRSLLSYLVSRGVFEQPAPGHFARNAAASQLFDGPQAQFLDLGGIGGRMAYAWGTLPGYVRTGQPGYHELYGRPFWDDVAAHPGVAASFDELMGLAGHGPPDPDLELSDGWDQVRMVVDVGGGTGAMLAAILRARPQVRGTLVNLPGAVARSGAVFAAAGVAGRATPVAQSFFDPLPAGADLYLLKKVLNDWPDAETVAILRRCAEAARPSGTGQPAGRVLVLGGVAPDGEEHSLAIDMVLTGGRTSSLTEFREQARQAGLAVTAAGQQKSGFVVECRAA